MYFDSSHHKQKSVMSELLIEMWNIKQYTSGKCCPIELCESNMPLFLSDILLAYIHYIVISTYGHYKKMICILIFKQIFQQLVYISHCGTSQFWLSIVPVLNNHMWLVGAVLDSAPLQITKSNVFMSFG